MARATVRGRRRFCREGPLFLKAMEGDADGATGDGEGGWGWVDAGTGRRELMNLSRARARDSSEGRAMTNCGTVGF